MSVQDLSECEPSQSSANDQNFAMFVDAPHGRLARAIMVWDGISSDIEHLTSPRTALWTRINTHTASNNVELWSRWISQRLTT
jgi:hypothetical protein